MKAPESSERQANTYTFSNTLLYLLQEGNGEFAAEVKRMLDEYLVEWGATEPPTTGAVSAWRGRKLHMIAQASLDKIMDVEPTKSEISCRQGCAHCCHMHVAVTLPEADLLVRYAVAEGFVLDLDQMQKQINFGDSPEAWAREPEAARRCLFLGADNRCRAYEARPLSCRKYYVSTPPEACQIVEGQAKEVAIRYDIDVEILTTAAFTHFSVGSMPEMIQQAWERWLADRSQGGEA